MTVTTLDKQGDDTDGNGGDDKRLDDGVTADHLSAIDAAADTDGLKNAYTAAYKAADAVGDKGAIRLFIQHKDARKKALGIKS